VFALPLSWFKSERESDFVFLLRCPLIHIVQKPPKCTRWILVIWMRNGVLKVSIKSDAQVLFQWVKFCVVYSSSLAWRNRDRTARRCPINPPCFIASFIFFCWKVPFIFIPLLFASKPCKSNVPSKIILGEHFFPSVFQIRKCADL
jgi:hypothetical protein